MKITLDYCKGSGGGSAIYLQTTDDDGGGTGYRIAGPKCWGSINSVSSYEMSMQEVDEAIEELRTARKALAQKEGE